jgi:predicted MFS family arabinose efflux permease
MMSASSIGAVLVAVPLATRADGPGVWRLMVLSGMVFGGGVFALGLSNQFLVAFAVVAVVGAGTTGYQSLSNTLALNMTDDSHHGRVQSLMMLSFAGFGIAAAPLGLLAEWIGLRPAIMLMGLAALLAVVIYALMEYRTEHEIGRGPSPQPVQAASLDLPK